MNNRLIVLAGILLLGLSALGQNRDRKVKALLDNYFLSYNTSYTTEKDRCKIETVKVNVSDQRVDLHMNEIFYGQSFTNEKVKEIYSRVKALLPSPYNKYRITIYGNNIPIEYLVTAVQPDLFAAKRTWGKTVYQGAPWVEQLQRPYTITHGMQQRHLAVWASHGRYYKNDKKEWTWQRPYLYCTTEDLFTQTFVIPFLIPMLENAGAYVFTPRERDWQMNEIIVDNDKPQTSGFYQEYEGQYAWETCGLGFAPCKPLYLDGENPFIEGTSRSVHTVTKKNQTSEVRWTPIVNESGQYAVYVSYPTLPTNVPDARYTVRHNGVNTTFRVNQQMGGATWVYLGTFYFGKDNPQDNFVSLSNMSNYRGTVSADAVRLGGGMGNIARGDLQNETVSGLPRFLEGARYNAQWNGMPYAIYSGKNGMNDYADDINVRSAMTNYLAGGSVYLPADSGLNVPIEMTVAIHSDAGIAPDTTYIGTLGIYTSSFNEGKLASGLSRLTSRDLCDMVMSQVDSDMKNIYGRWKRRQIYDRNYSETREPQIPSMILEMLSHQNFRDMVHGHDPVFKFNYARAVYKGILRYSSYLHRTEYKVQPLPVMAFHTRIDVKSKQITLSWLPQQDCLEASATPTGYIVYTKVGENDFDNGTYVHKNNYTLTAQANTIYTFKVTAVNEGGESFPSEELSAMISRNNQSKILIIDGFNRVASPQVIQTDSLQGFDMASDPGVPFRLSPAFCGRQLVFNTLTNSKDLWGVSGNEQEGNLMAGNNFDHSRLHGEAIATAGNYSFASASRAALEHGMVNMNDYEVVDLILGLQKDDGYSSRSYPTLTTSLCNALREFTRMHGRLLVSGAYIARDQRNRETLDFLRHTLKVDAYAPIVLDGYSQVSGMNTLLNLYSEYNEKHYAVTHADCLMPVHPAFSTLLYAPQNYSAAIAYRGEDYRAITMGFPFECIKYAADRDKIMMAFLQFLLDK